MGTYTTNYNLYMPTVGEQSWGTLVNGNFSTIDTTMQSLSNRITAVENEVNGALSCTSVTTSGKVTANGGVGTTSLTTSSTITSTGLITANGGIKGNLTGKINISSCAASGDIKLLNVTFSNPSLAHEAHSTSNRTLSIPNSTSSNVTQRMSSVFNYTGDKTSINANSTCTITVKLTNTRTGTTAVDTTYTINVTDNTTNTKILNNTQLEISGSLSGGASKTVSTTFTRNAAHNYTLTIKSDSSSSTTTYGVTLSTPTTYAYIPV